MIDNTSIIQNIRDAILAEKLASDMESDPEKKAVSSPKNKTYQISNISKLLFTFFNVTFIWLSSVSTFKK